jgi:hypothetical protein
LVSTATTLVGLVTIITTIIAILLIDSPGSIVVGLDFLRLGSILPADPSFGSTGWAAFFKMVFTSLLEATDARLRIGSDESFDSGVALRRMWIGLLLLIRWSGWIARLGVGTTSTIWNWEFEAKSSLEAAFALDTI